MNFNHSLISIVDDKRMFAIIKVYFDITKHEKIKSFFECKHLSQSNQLFFMHLFIQFFLNTFNLFIKQTIYLKYLIDNTLKAAASPGWL